MKRRFASFEREAMKRLVEIALEHAEHMDAYEGQALCDKATIVLEMLNHEIVDQHLEGKE